MNRERQVELQAKLEGLGEWSNFETFLRPMLETDCSRSIAWDRSLTAYERRYGGAEAILSRDRMTIEEFVALVSGNGQGSILQNVEWVAQNLNTPYSEIDAATSPGSTAVNLLAWAKANVRDFWSTFYARFIPTRSEVDAGHRFRDDGRDVNELIDDLERIHYELKADAEEREKLKVAG